MTEESPSEMARRMAIAAVEREMAHFNRPEPLVPRRARRRAGGESISYSIRLDRREVEMLEAQADENGLRPTVLARNLIRSGLAARHAPALADAIDRLEQAVAEVRSLVP